MRSLLPVFCLLLAWTKGAWGSDHNLPFMVYLDQNQMVCLEWGFDELKGNIEFKLAVNTTGWVGFGFSPDGEMEGADIVIGGVRSNGVYFKDYHAKGEYMPLEDDKQNYDLLSMNEKEGQTIMMFQRSLDTCDDKDFHITAQPINLIYAYGTDDEISYHRNRRGVKEVNLLNYMPRTSLPHSAHYLSARVENITVPQIHTYYHCKIMKFSNLSTKLHVYRVEPLIEHHDIVHHILLYRCSSSVTQEYEMPCTGGEMEDACMGVVAGWAVGGEGFELPENAGIPVGGNNNDVYYRLEIHYNNPQLERGRTDSSGLLLYYTEKLRQHDAGIMTTGVAILKGFPRFIPPKAQKFHTYGVCNTTLFSLIVDPVPDLRMFAVLLHTHLAGRKVRVGHYRDGKQIGFLGLDESYNFQMQKVMNLGNIKTIKPKDEIAVECTYNTVNRTEFTEMGYATTDEMCLAFLFYYPAIEITTCVSHPNTTSLSNSSYEMEHDSNHDEIAEYESKLKSLPQINLISDNHGNMTFYQNGIIRDMMKSPTAMCESKNASSGLHSIWIIHLGGIMFFLARIGII